MGGSNLTAVHFRSAFASAAALIPAAAAKAEDAAGVASSRMSYSRFLEYLEMGRVKKVSRHNVGFKFACTEWQAWMNAMIWPFFLHLPPWLSM